MVNTLAPLNYPSKKEKTHSILISHFFYYIINKKGVKYLWEIIKKQK